MDETGKIADELAELFCVALPAFALSVTPLIIERDGVALFHKMFYEMSLSSDVVAEIVYEDQQSFRVMRYPVLIVQTETVVGGEVLD